MKFCPVCGKEYESGEVCTVDGTVLVRSQQGMGALIGQVLKDSYRIEEQIGEGGMGAVFRGVQMTLGRDVAIKILLPSLQSTPSMIQRFFQEAKLLSQLNHPNVVSIIDFGNTETGMIYMVMEYLTGSILGQIIPPGKGLPLPDTLRLMRQLCAGVEAAHHCRLIHRDLKPGNIFVSKRAGSPETVKILDFGIARALEVEQETRLTRTGLLMGTPGFLAPEQIDESRDADARSDIYALGAILYLMLTGRRPYEGKTPHSILVRQLQEPPSVDLSPIADREPLAAVVLRAMHLDPESRFQKPGEIVDALEEALDPAEIRSRSSAMIPPSSQSQSSIVTPPSSPGSTGGQPLEPTLLPDGSSRPGASLRGPSRRRLWLTTALIVIAACVAGWFLWSGERSRSRADRHDASASGTVGSLTGTVRGVSESQITIGMSAAFSGPSKELGRGMKLGIETWFREVNEQGGVHGRQLQLVALDDGYEPARTVANMAQLLLERQVFAILGNVGTPTAEVAVPFAQDQKVPFFGAFTGADLLRKQPPDRYVFNLRARYAQEAAAIVAHLVDGLGFQPKQIAVFAQEDAFGDAGYRGVVSALEDRGYVDRVPRLGYRRNTLEIDNTIEQLLSQYPEVRGVVLAATYRVAAELIRRLGDRGADLTFSNLSFVGSRAFAEELRGMGPHYADGVIVTQVVPHFASEEPGVVRHRALLAKHFPAESPSFVSLEGYLAAQVFVEALSRAGADLSVEGLIAATESISDLDLEIGSMIHFSETRHQGLERVWGTRLDAASTYQPLALGEAP